MASSSIFSKLAQLMPGGQQVLPSDIVPSQDILRQVQDGQELVRGKWNEGGECDGKVRAELQGHAENGGGAVHVGLGHLPGLGVGEVLVAEAGEVHGLLEGLAEAVMLEGVGDGGLEGRYLCKGIVIYGLMLEVGGHLSVEILVGQDDGAVDEVAVDGCRRWPRARSCCGSGSPSR